ncbi:MAG: hypothetical protein IIB61_08250 [Planctomycetes bacterium]|nr:hypothetical protein [Planctomycetota bacterium]
MIVLRSDLGEDAFEVMIGANATWIVTESEFHPNKLVAIVEVQKLRAGAAIPEQALLFAVKKYQGHVDIAAPIPQHCRVGVMPLRVHHRIRHQEALAG